GGVTKSFARLLDRPIQSLAWDAKASDDDRFRWTLYAVADSGGTEPVVELRLHEGGGVSVVAEPPPQPVASGGVDTGGQVAGGPFGPTLVFVRGTADRPGELYKAVPGSHTGPVALTHHNDGLVAGLDLPPAVGFTFKGADGDDVSGWLVKPPGFD